MYTVSLTEHEMSVIKGGLDCALKSFGIKAAKDISEVLIKLDESSDSSEEDGGKDKC